jgi:hypothetical protein
MDGTVSNHDYYVRRAEECCTNFSDARSAAEKQVWLTIAESWLIMARNKSDVPLQGLAQGVLESGRENRAWDRRVVQEVTTEAAQEVANMIRAKSDPKTSSVSEADPPSPLLLRGNSLRSWMTRSDTSDNTTLHAAVKIQPR